MSKRSEVSYRRNDGRDITPEEEGEEGEELFESAGGRPSVKIVSGEPPCWVPAAGELRSGGRAKGRRLSLFSGVPQRLLSGA